FSRNIPAPTSTSMRRWNEPMGRRSSRWAAVGRNTVYENLTKAGCGAGILACRRLSAGAGDVMQTGHAGQKPGGRQECLPHILGRTQCRENGWLRDRNLRDDAIAAFVREHCAGERAELCGHLVPGQRVLRIALRVADEFVVLLAVLQFDRRSGRPFSRE